MRTAEEIREYRTQWHARRRRLMAYGRWEPTEQLDPTPVREHIDSLRRLGLSLQTIADLAGEQVGAMSQIVYPGKRDYLKWITPKRAARILAVDFDLDLIPSGRNVDPTGTRRRIEALMLNGWSQGHIGAELGVSRERVRKYRVSAHVESDTARAVRDLFERLWDKPGPEIRATNKAIREGFAPAAAWDDIDDPNEQPQGVAAPSKRLSEDVAEDVEHLLRFDPLATARQLSQRLGYADDSGVQNALKRAGRTDLLDRLTRNAELAGHNVTSRRTA